MPPKIPSSIVLRYFNIPARAEATRLALKIANIPFIDERIPKEKWSSIKPTIQPWGQLPVLIADGLPIYQTHNIELYVGKFTGLYPEDLHEQLRVNEIMFALDDISSIIASTNGIQDATEKLNARRALSAPGGKLYDFLKKIEQFLGNGEYVLGGKFSIGDLSLFAKLGTLVSGMFDGIDESVLQDFPILQAHFHRVASIPQVIAHYEAEPATWAKYFKPSV